MSTLLATSLGRVTSADPLLEITTPFSPPFTASSPDTSVTIQLGITQTDPVRPMLGLRGMSVDRDEPEAYEIDTNTLRIPCPGEFRLHATTEDSSNGNGSRYSALLKLFSPSVRPAGARDCGSAPPPLPGHMSILLQSRADRLFVVRGSRSNAGAFEGGLTLSSMPECDKNYTLATTVDLAGWSRDVEFKAQAIKFGWELQGMQPESRRC